MTYLIRNQGDVTRANNEFNYNRVPHLESAFPEHANGLVLVDKLAHPRHIKTHLSYDLLPQGIGRAKIIYPMRNPKDTLVSYFHYYKSTTSLGRFRGSWNEFFEMFLNNNQCYGNLFDHYLGYWKHKDDGNIMFTTFEDLIRHPHEEVARIAEFCGVELNDDSVNAVVEATKFGAMKKNPKTNYSSVPEDIDIQVSPFMRKGVVGDWKNYFTVAQDDLMDKIIASRLRGSGLTFVYE